ncbi:hypothetical protein CRYUN_Cryun03dG0106000 [Craigia yunnanensis]
MAILLNKNLHWHSLSRGTKLYSGLKLQSPCLFATGRPNLSVDFYSRVNKRVQCGTRNCKPIKSLVGMMLIGTPKVSYRVPSEGTCIDDDKRPYSYINGLGGDLTSSLAIYDTMQKLEESYRHPLCKLGLQSSRLPSCL